MKNRYKIVLKRFLFWGIMLSGSSAFAATFDWSSTGWNDGDTSGSFTDVDGSGIDVTVTITGNTGNFDTNYPQLNNDGGGLSNDHLEEDLNFDDNTQSVTTTFKFSVPVKLSSLIWRDIDAMNQSSWSGTTLFDDKIIITAKDTNGNIIYPNNAQLGSNIQDDGNGAYEAKDNNQNYSPEDAAATLQVDLNSTYVTEFSYIYTSGDGIGSGNNPTTQATWFDNFNFEPKDTDGDGIPDFQDLDDDGDGILDSVEIQGGGTCAYGFFHVISGQLNMFDPENKVYVPIGGSKVTYNGMGYDMQSGKLYASVKEKGQDDYGNDIYIGNVIEIDRYSGKIKLVDSDTDVVSATGDFYSGKLYFRNGSKYLTSWNQSDGSVQVIGNQAIDFVDMAIDATGTYAYGLITDTNNNTTALYKVKLSDGTISSTSLGNISTPDGGDLAAGWGATFMTKDSGGTRHFFAANNNGYIYEIDGFDGSTPSATFVYRSIDTSSNDGASCRDANQYAVDTDGDGIPDYKDLDSDNDGIPDNVEAQSTDSYTAPSGTDADGDGLDDAYDSDTSGKPGSNGLIPPDKDGDNYADFVDTDTDNDGYGDCEEGQDPTKVNRSCSTDGKTVTGTLQSNGLVDWAGSDGYTDVNGNVNDPTSDLVNETGDTSEVAYREFLCGKALITLTAYQWRLVSVPCDTGSNGVEALLQGSLGAYGEPEDGGHWVMYAQDGSDNYETNSSHPNTTKTKLDENSTLVQGISYWIITDADHNMTINEKLSNISPTTTQDANATGVNITDPDFTKVAIMQLPNNIMNVAGDVKKYMAGNPFPYSFHLGNLYFKHYTANSNTYYPMGDTNNDNYIKSVVYTHDSSDTGPVTGYTAIDPSTPGFGGSIRPMEGFFIKLLEENTDNGINSFAFPLIMSNQP